MQFETREKPIGNESTKKKFVLTSVLFLSMSKIKTMFWRTEKEHEKKWWCWFILGAECDNNDDWVACVNVKSARE